MAHFEFSTAARIVFGQGAFSGLAAEAARLSPRVFIVTGRSGRHADRLAADLKALGAESVSFAVQGEPTAPEVVAAAGRARAVDAGAVVGLGGGGALDTAKAVAALLTNPGDLYDYLEVIGRARPLPNPPAPFITAPTTAGTGAEVTRNAVIGSPEHRVKVSLRSPLLAPSLALVDPNLTLSLPPAETAASGLDALTQLIEAYVSNAASPLTDGFCREGLSRAARALRRVFEDGSDAAAREDMALAALLSGLALANAKLGAVHGFAGPLGGMLENAGHGMICAALLPRVMRANLLALRARAAGSGALERFAEIARLLTGNPSARAEDGVAWVEETCAALRAPRLAHLGLAESDIAEAAAKARAASSMKGNPVILTDQELTDVLRAAL